MLILHEDRNCWRYNLVQSTHHYRDHNAGPVLRGQITFTVLAPKDRKELVRVGVMGLTHSVAEAFENGKERSQYALTLALLRKITLHR